MEQQSLNNNQSNAAKSVDIPISRSAKRSSFIPVESAASGLLTPSGRSAEGDMYQSGMSQSDMSQSGMSQSGMYQSGMSQGTSGSSLTQNGLPPQPGSSGVSESRNISSTHSEFMSESR